ncbi:MAG: sugar kinase [Myxococcales bacterium]|nr:sugar kinase [Myxococcales bacterium]
MSPILVVGSVAFDTLHNSQGSFPRVLGGSAVFASVCASLMSDVRLVGVVGEDYPESAKAMLRDRGVDLSGLEVSPGETFHWEGRYTDDLTSRESIRTDLNVFASFQPKIPQGFKDSPFVMLANIQPELQLSVLDQIRSPKLVVADTMNLWIDIAKPALLKLLARVDVLIINEEEARQLTERHHLVEVQRALLALGPKTVIVKQGEYGAWLFQEGVAFHAPAFPLEQVVDPTGAGDSFAGGFLGHLAQRDSIALPDLRQAVVVGSALASFCVEGIGTTRLVEVTKADVEQRVADFAKLVRV